MLFAAMIAFGTPVIQFAFLGITLVGWLAIAALAVSAAGTGYSVYAQNQAANAAEKAAEQQRAYRESAKKAENRRYAILKATAAGRARALYAKGGVVPETGTPLEVMGLQALELERDRRMAEYSILATGSAAEFSASAAASRR